MMARGSADFKAGFRVSHEDGTKDFRSAGRPVWPGRSITRFIYSPPRRELLFVIGRFGRRLRRSFGFVRVGSGVRIWNARTRAGDV